MKKKKQDGLKIGNIRLPPNAVKVVLCVEVLAVLLTVSEYMKSKNGFDNTIPRPAQNEDDAEEELIAAYQNDKEDVTVHISKRAYTEDEAEALFEKARQEIDETVFGKNKSAGEVSTDLVVKDSYADGAVDAVWNFSERFVNEDGSIDWTEFAAVADDAQHTGSATEAADSPAQFVYAEVRLSCGDYETEYTFPFQVTMPDKNTAGGFSVYLSQALIAADEDDPESESVTLPKNVAGKAVSWQTPRSHTGAELAVLGLLAGVAVVIGEKEQKKREVKKRESGLNADYPEIVSALSLYVGAGLPVKSAFFRITDSYLERKKRTKQEQNGFECVAAVTRKMQGGASELAAYHTFGEIGGQKNYRKLSLLLTQNLKKGTADLIALLEGEEREAFELRKNMAKVKGEEASTKLLLPMIGMLMMMLVIMIVPALQGIEM